MQENTNEKNIQLMENYKLILENCNPDRLEKLYFNWSTLYPYMMQLVCKTFSKTLTEITFRYLNSVDQFWKSLSSLSGLRKLTIEDCTFQDTEIHHLSKMNSLRDLQLIWNLGLPVDGIEQISKLHGLQRVSLNGNDLDFMNTCAFKHLGDLSNITHLSLEFSTIDDNILVSLCDKLTHLENLSIAGCKTITNTSIQNLSTLSLPLKSLNFSHTYITDTALADIHRLRKLQKLYMRNTTITDTGTSYLQGSTALMLIDLSYTLITYKTLVHLEKLTALRFLSINATNITKMEIAKFKQLPTFTSLEVTGPQSLI